MNKTIKNYLLLLLLVVSASCTHNNGDIGPLFGQWKLMSIDNGTEQSTEANIYWQFQSSVFQVIEVKDQYTVTRIYGQWEQTGDELTIEFPDGDFQPLPTMPLDKTNRFKIIELKQSEMVLMRTDASKGTIKYRLKKW